MIESYILVTRDRTADVLPIKIFVRQFYKFHSIASFVTQWEFCVSFLAIIIAITNAKDMICAAMIRTICNLSA